MKTTSVPKLKLPITARNPSVGGGWTRCTVLNHRVDALIFPTGSHYGIGWDPADDEKPEAEQLTGRISKLDICEPVTGERVYSWDRGYEEDAEAISRSLINTIVEILEAAEYYPVRRLSR